MAKSGFGPGCLILKPVHVSAKMELLIFYYKPASPSVFPVTLSIAQPPNQEVILWFLSHLTPPSNPLASDFSSTSQRDQESIHLSPLPHIIIFCLDDYKSPVFVTPCCCNSCEGWFPGNPFFIFCLRKDNLTFLFPINTYEAPTVDRHCFCILTKNVMDNPKYKEVSALLDRKTKYSTL